MKGCELDNLEEALRIVEDAGFTVVDDRRLVEHYHRRERYFRTLLRRSSKGDWLAASVLIKHIRGCATHLPYSPALRDFVDLLMRLALSQKTITTKREVSKRIKYPMLAALLGTDSRTDYVLRERKRGLFREFQAYMETGAQHDVKRILGHTKQGQKERTALFEWLSLSDGAPATRIEKWINEVKDNPENME